MANGARFPEWNSLVVPLFTSCAAFYLEDVVERRLFQLVISLGVLSGGSNVNPLSFV